MGSFSIWHWLIVLVVVLILFGGKGKISQIMGDVGKGLKAFKKSVKEDEMPEQRATFDQTKVLNSGSDEVSGPVQDPDRAAKS
ncbi:MAG: twin-arginine translocase TatA/TatE family subunit [Rhodospirillales bacterium]|nr:twin-arginine translocase TatA/TatE family subunit [Rhodospirillales bacterium]